MCLAEHQLIHPKMRLPRYTSLHSNFTLVSPMRNTRHSPVCIPRGILWPIPSYAHVWARLLPHGIRCPPFCHCGKASLVSSSGRCWNTCHSAKGLLVSSLFQLALLSLDNPKEYSQHQRKIHVSTVMKRDQSNSHLQKRSGFPLLSYRAVNYPEIPFFKLENGSQ